MLRGDSRRYQRLRRTLGITEQIGRICSEFYPVVHDPCPGQKAPPVLPTPSLITSGGADQWGTAAALVVVSVVMGW
jgi:hypothetical protein